MGNWAHKTNKPHRAHEPHWSHNNYYRKHHEKAINI